MTRHETRLIEAARSVVGDPAARQAVERLFAAGLIDLAACERQLVVGEVERLTRQGMKRCDALHAAARMCCCSYEKARSSYYYQIKKQKP